MNFVAVSANSGDPGRYVAAEAHALDELVHDGIVERVLLKADYSGAVLLLKATDEGTARAALDALPIAAHGLTRFALVPVVDPPPAPPGTTSASAP